MSFKKSFQKFWRKRGTTIVRSGAIAAPAIAGVTGGAAWAAGVGAAGSLIGAAATPGNRNDKRRTLLYAGLSTGAATGLSLASAAVSGDNLLKTPLWKSIGHWTGILKRNTSVQIGDVKGISKSPGPITGYAGSFNPRTGEYVPGPLLPQGNVPIGPVTNIGSEAANATQAVSKASDPLGGAIQAIGGILTSVVGGKNDPTGLQAALGNGQPDQTQVVNAGGTNPSMAIPTSIDANMTQGKLLLIVAGVGVGGYFLFRKAG